MLFFLLHKINRSRWKKNTCLVEEKKQRENNTHRTKRKQRHIVSGNCTRFSFEPHGGVDLVGKCLLRVTIHYGGKFIQCMPWHGECKSGAGTISFGFFLNFLKRP